MGGSQLRPDRLLRGGLAEAFGVEAFINVVLGLGPGLGGAAGFLAVHALAQLVPIPARHALAGGFAADEHLGFLANFEPQNLYITLHQGRGFGRHAQGFGLA